MQTDPWFRFLGWQVRVLMEREGIEFDDPPSASDAGASVTSAERAPSPPLHAGRHWWSRLQRRRAA